MSNSKAGLRVVVFAILAAACALAQEPTSKEPRGRGMRDLPPTHDPRVAGAAEIRAAIANWQKAIDAKDTEKCAAFYAPDASILPPGAPVISTAEARRDFWKQFLADATVKIRLETWRIEVARSGEVGYETGAFTETSKDAKGKVLVVKGKNVVVWKKQADATWKIAVDIFNGDM